MPDTRVIARDEPSTTLFQRIYNRDGWSWSWALLAFDLRDRNTLPQLHTAADKDWSFAPPGSCSAQPSRFRQPAITHLQK